MIQKHCFECGTALIEKELEEEGIVPYCPKCQQYRFPMYNVAVSMIVVDEETGKILLIQQYGKLSYILVAGYVNRGEAEEHAVVREFLADTGMTAEQIDRVAYLVGHHHSPAQIDGIEYQILIEADYIVNASESGYDQQAIRTFMEHTMKTAAGIRLTKTVFGV